MESPPAHSSLPCPSQLQIQPKRVQSKHKRLNNSSEEAFVVNAKRENKRSVEQIEPIAAESANREKRKRENIVDVETGKYRLACPYNKREPQKYRADRHSKHYKKCASGGFPNTRRVKEHLLRKHVAPIQCDRCCATLPSEEALRLHRRAETACAISDHSNLAAGINSVQEKKLRSKTRTSGSEEEKWRKLYSMLFPGEPVPSPYESTIEEETQVIRLREVDQLTEYAPSAVCRLVMQSITSITDTAQFSPEIQALQHCLPGILETSVRTMLDEYRAEHLGAQHDVGCSAPLQSGTASSMMSLSSPSLINVSLTSQSPETSDAAHDSASISEWLYLDPEMVAFADAHAPLYCTDAEFDILMPFSPVDLSPLPGVS